MRSNSMMGSIPMRYPWPDPTNKRIKQLEAERDALLRLKIEREAEIVRLEVESKRLRDDDAGMSKDDECTDSVEQVARDMYDQCVTS